MFLNLARKVSDAGKEGLCGCVLLVEGEMPTKNRKSPSRKRIFPKKIVKKLLYFCSVIKARLNYHTKYCST